STGGPGDPPFGDSSHGSGGPSPVSGTLQNAGGVDYRLIVPGGSGPMPFLLVYSGVEGGQTMTNNLMSVEAMTGTSDMIRAVLDGKVYFGNGQAGASVLDDVRSKYDVDNDRT